MYVYVCDYGKQSYKHNLVSYIERMKKKVCRLKKMLENFQ